MKDNRSYEVDHSRKVILDFHRDANSRRMGDTSTVFCSVKLSFLLSLELIARFLISFSAAQAAYVAAIIVMLLETTE